MDAGAAIGVDIGSSKAVLAAVRKGGIDIILSDSSNKQTPLIVAYTDEERLIGDSAVNQQKKNFKNTLQFFPRFLGLNTDCVDQLKEEEKYVTYKIVPLENKKIGFEVNVRGSIQVVTPEQVLAYYFKKVKKLFEIANIMSNEIVISVPSYFSNAERQAMLDAAEIANLKPLRLINESTAIALNYGFFRRPDLHEKDPRIVAFVDLGHSKLTVTIASFLKGKMKIIVHNSDRNFGARNFDDLLVDILGEEFFKKVGSDPRKNVRARLRMLDIIEKQRKILSANIEATIHLESLLEDEDLHKNLKRAEFEKLIQPYTDKLAVLLQDAIDKSGLKKEQIHSVEMVGEATRIPIVQEKCKEVFGKDQVSRTLNSMECVARGCSLQAAMLSPLFKVSDYEVQEYNSLPVSISYSFFPLQGEEQPKLIVKELFPVASSFPSTKTITFDNKRGGLDLLVHYTQGTQLIQGLPTQIAQYKIKEAKLKHPEGKHSFILRISNNIHQIPCLESAELQEEWTEEEKIAVKKDVPASTQQQPPADGSAQPDQPIQEEQKQQEAPKQEFETRKKNKKSTSTLNIESSSHALPSQVKTQFLSSETQWFNEDEQILEFKAVKNELESFVYDMRNNIQDYGSLEKYVDPAARDAFLNQLNHAVDWIYGEGQSAAKELYRQKLDEFKKVGLPIKQRALFYQEFPIFLDQFKNFTQEVNDKIANGTGNLTDQIRSDIINKLTEAANYFNTVNQATSTKKGYEEPGFDIQEVHNKLEAYKNTINSLLNAQPPKQDAPKADQQQQQQPPPQPDVEMKEELPGQAE